MEGIVCFALVLILDSGILYYTTEVKKPQVVEDEDEDVAEQKEIIRNYSEDEIKSNFVSAGKDMTKYYEEVLAVNGLSFGVKPYGCFGLLGMWYVTLKKFNKILTKSFIKFIQISPNY